MASLNPTEDEQQQQQPGAPLAVSGTAGASAAGGQGQNAGVGGAAPASPVMQNQAPQANTGYTDVASYLDANQAGSQQLGEQVAGNLTNTYNQTKSGIDSSAQSAQQAADKGYTHDNADLIRQVASNPVEAAKTQGNAATVQSLLSDQYTGPSDWADLGTQQGKVNEAMQTGALTTTPGGLNVLAQKVEGPTASQGVNQLDSLLLGGSPGAMSTVQAAADPFKTLNDYINQQNTAVKSSITGAQSAADAARTNANNALLGPNGATSQLNSGVDARVASSRQAAQAQNDQIKAALGTENPTPEQLASIGVSADQWNNLQSQLSAAQGSKVVSSNQGQFQANTGTTDVDLRDWLQQESPDTAITRQNSATSDEYARAQALQQLVGDNNFKTDLTDPTQAGTAPGNLSKFDFNSALGTTRDIASAEQASAQAYVDALQSGADEEHAQLAAKNASQNFGFASAANMSTLGGPTAAMGAGKEVASQFSNPTSAAKNTALNIATGGLYTPVKALGSGVKTVTNMFCFHPDTLVDMADGTQLPIWKIQLGDKTLGGTVLATKKAIGTDFYWYRGVLVTGKHAVKEGDKWLRVEQSQLGRRIPNFTEVVHNLVTSEHRIFAHDVEFADEYETDLYESLDLNQSIKELNRRESVG
jgi:hypothetical protein